MQHELAVHQIELEMQNEELRLAQVALDSALEHYVDLYDHAPIGYISVSEAGLILQANFRTAALLGLARGALAGRPFSSLICMEDQDIYYLCHKKTAETDQTQSCDLRVMKNDGRPFWVNLANSVVQDSDGAPVHRIVLSDITDRKRIEQALAESEILKESILNSLAAEIAVVDHRGMIIAVNQPWRLFGLENSITPGKSVPQIDVGANYLAVCKQGMDLATDDAVESSAAIDGIRAVLGGRLPSFSLEYPCHSSSQQRWFSMVVTPLEEAGRRGAVITHTNITERKHAEQQLAKFGASLDGMVKERTRQLRIVSAQLSISEEHERRMLAQELHDNLVQLLAVIKIKLTSLDANSFQSSVRQIVELVDQADRSARTITRQLSPPILNTLGFVPALSWLAREMEHTHDLSVRFNCETEPRPLIEGVQAVLYRSVRELLINIARHAKTNQASLSVRVDANHLVVVVSDTGCGFDSAGFSDATLRHSGFGLSSVFERITNIGGEMYVESRAKTGTTITLKMAYSIAAKETLTS